MVAPASDRFIKAIKSSHDVHSYVMATSPSGETVRLPVTGGNVKVDRTASVRRSVTIQCIDPLGTLTPSGLDSLLTPYGTEIRPYRGVIHSDGEIEVYPLGVFRISKVSISDTSGGSIILGVEGFDRSRKMSRDKFTVPYLIPGGTNVVTAIQNIVERTYPDIEYDILTTTLTTTAPRFYDANDDPWEACMELAQSIGCEIYFNVDGWLTLATPVDMDSMPSADFTYIEGHGNTMTSLSQVYSDEPGYNGVIVVGESSGDENPAVRGEAWDEEPSSATYRKGPYGEVPLFVQDKIVKTEADANAAALGLLNNLLGFSSQLDIDASVNPAYEAGHVVEVVRALSHVDGVYTLDAFNIPLSSSGSQSMILRQKRVR